MRLVLTWFPSPPAQLVGPLASVTDPYLTLFRGIIPPLGGTIDLSPILAFLVLEVGFLPVSGQSGQTGHICFNLIVCSARHISIHTAAQVLRPGDRPVCKVGPLLRWSCGDAGVLEHGGGPAGAGGAGRPDGGVQRSGGGRVDPGEGHRRLARAHGSPAPAAEGAGAAAGGPATLAAVGRGEQFSG